MRHTTSPLSLIAGGLDRRFRAGTTQLAVVPMEAPAPVLDAVVVEQDTYGLLGVELPLALPMTTPSAEQLHSELAAFEPYCPGEVVARRATPLQLLAIVHDLDETPSWREAWIATALDSLLTLARQRHLQRIGMPLLGTVHGRFSRQRSLELLVTALQHRTDGPRQIWLGVPRSQCSELIAQLQQLCTE